MHDERIIVPRRTEPRPQIRVEPAPVLGAIEEIRNDADFALHAQGRYRVGAQAARHRGHGVRLLDGKGDDPRVRRIAADERDIRAVQRRHHPRAGEGGRGRQHLIGEICRRCVRNGVVRVNDVEPPLFRDTRNRVDQRQQILRLAKQRVGRDFDRVEGQPRDAAAPAERRIAADQMNLVAARGKRVRQLGRHDAAPANRGVADHADIHGRCFSRPARAIGSRTTSPSANATPASAPNCASRLSISWRNVEAVRRVGTASLAGGANWLR